MLRFTLLLVAVHTVTSGSLHDVTNASWVTSRLRADACDVSLHTRIDCYPEPGSTQSGCEGRGCCWRIPPGQPHDVPWCFHPSSQGTQGNRQCSVPDSGRADCHPDTGASQAACQTRGCCWTPSAVDGVSWCFHPADDVGYHVTHADHDRSASLHRDKATHWPHEIADLQVKVTKETQQRVRFRITDPNASRFEVPLDVPKVSGDVTQTDYDVHIKQSPFGVVVTRKSTGSVLFDSSVTPLVYSDQFLQVSTSLPTRHIYGLGEHSRRFLIKAEGTTTHLAFWGLDAAVYRNGNSYGTHPFFLGIESDGNAFGVFLLNSNAMDVQVLGTTPPMLTYRTIGGILDFYVFTGPTPDSVIQQYTEVIGRPYLPPYWAMGYHISRWGYGGDAGVRTVVQRLRDARIPWDTQWADIDYMQDHLDFTLGHDFQHLPDVINDLHSHGQKMVVIVDPGISSTQPRGSYAPYDDGLQQDIFIKKTDGSGPLIGEVWPGLTTFPDFSHPKAEDWWFRHANTFHKTLPYDGLWIDMNEIANFRDGSVDGCPANQWNNPPYVPPITGGRLAMKTVCPSARQHISINYNLHNMYGFMEAKATNNVLKRVMPGKRPFLLSRSTYAGSGHYTSHWEGDNSASWEDLEYSIPEVLSFNMFGIPHVGPDLCGFIGYASTELCTRWMQVGSFYPFMRTHRRKQDKEQDPSIFDAHTQDIMRSAITHRYRLLPFLYTLMQRAHAQGTGVVRSLAFSYPKDANTHPIDKQFMWGNDLLISPVLAAGQRSVSAYFPADTWYDYYTGKALHSTGQTVTLDAPLEKINVHVRGGAVIPTQEPDITTTKSRQKNFGLLVALSSRGLADGTLYWDDGESQDAIDGTRNNMITFHATSSGLRSTVVHAGYTTTMTLGSVDIYGVTSNPAHVVVNGNSAASNYDSTNKVLHITRLDASLLSPLTITWS